ncbi:MAG: squalene/phytoene synthase family protein [Chloroflexi bacterium]|nr:squalene/phytoene synthase family protein [Chloroflexota bacterium]
MITHRDMLRAASRTFALSIERLPGILGEAIAIAYLLLRIMPPERKVALIHLWGQVLSGEVRVETLTVQLSNVDDPSPDADVARHAAEVLAVMGRLPAEVQQTIISSVRDTTEGMARWQARGPVVLQEADMDDYMHEVAGRVGYLVTHLFAWHADGINVRKDLLMPLAREFGLALQTVNVIRGLRKDFERGWVYVPLNFFAAVNIAPQDLFDPQYQSQAMQVVEMIADKAERHLLAGKAYVQAIPAWHHRIRLACMWPLLFAVRTLAISRHDAAVLAGEAKVPRAEVMRIVRDSTLWGWSNTWFDYYFHQLGVVNGKGSPPGRIS